MSEVSLKNSQARRESSWQQPKIQKLLIQLSQAGISMNIGLLDQMILAPASMNIALLGQKILAASA